MRLDYTHHQVTNRRQKSARVLRRSLIAGILALASLALTSCHGTPGSKQGSSTSGNASGTGAESGQKGQAPDSSIGQAGAPGSSSRSDMTTSDDANAADDLKGAMTPAPKSR